MSDKVAEAMCLNVATLSLQGAQLALKSAEASAVAHDLKLSIAVVDHGGNLVAFTRMDGAGIGTVDAALRKAQTAARTGAPSAFFQEMVQDGATFLLAVRSITPLRGAIPVFLGGTPVGAVGASGGSGEEDELIARHGADALNQLLEPSPGSPASPSPQTSSISSLPSEAK